MFRPLELLLGNLIADGDLTVVDSRGKSSRFGNGSGKPVCVRFKDRRTEVRLCYDPDLAAGESYMQGQLAVEQGTLYQFLDILLRNLSKRPLPRWTSLVSSWRRCQRRISHNGLRQARKNAQYHYDVDPRIYALFLDSDQQYSCGYYASHSDLEEAQLLKKRHIASKLALDARHSVLDIGCGWGGLALYLAQATGADITGITLSPSQCRAANERAANERRAGQVRFELADYRTISGRYDRIVSVGMLEHVGRDDYRTYFDQILRLLSDDGVALVHTIGRSHEPSETSEFIRRYIFPGGYLPSLSELAASIEQSGLLLTDVEVLRLHYAKTLRAWRERFLERWDEAVTIAGEEFCRMWEFYLAGSEVAFRHQNLVVFQLQLAKDVTSLPLKRDYMIDAERRLASQEQREPKVWRSAS